jgi:poly(hydroxyalkanoate) granule-associated protein
MVPAANRSEEIAMPKKSKAKVAAPSAGRRKVAAGAGAKAANQVWPAGLETIAKAQHEGVKVFETLLKQGQRLEQKTREAAADTAAAARDTAMAARGAAVAKAREVQQIAGGTWDKLEQVFEDRVERALSKLGIYTQNDLQRLAERVDELAEAVNRLLKARGVAPKSPAPKAKRSAKRAARGAPKVARK